MISAYSRREETHLKTGMKTPSGANLHPGQGTKENPRIAGSKKLMATFQKGDSGIWQEKTDLRSRSFSLALYILGTHLTPSISGAKTVTIALGKLLDAIIYCDTAFAWCQVVLRNLNPS